jgi:hypothetical protein
VLNFRDTRIGSYSYAKSKSFPGLLVAAPDLNELSRVEKVGLITELHEILQSAFGGSGEHLHGFRIRGASPQ